MATFSGDVLYIPKSWDINPNPWYLEIPSCWINPHPWGHLRKTPRCRSRSPLWTPAQPRRRVSPHAAPNQSSTIGGPTPAAAAVVPWRSRNLYVFRLKTTGRIWGLYNRIEYGVYMGLYGEEISSGFFGDFTGFIFDRIEITLLRVIPTMTFIHFLTGKSWGIQSDISSGILFGILSGISSGRCSGISSGILSGKSSGILSGISSGILSGISSGRCSGISSGILSGKSSGILSGISSGILSDISSGILSGILSGISSGIYSDISSGILSGILSGISSGISIWHIFWHIFWHMFWHSIWHIFWHSIWQIFWHSIWHIFWHSIWHIFWHSIWHIFWHSIWHSLCPRSSYMRSGREHLA